MKDACKVMLQHLAEDGRVRVGYGSSLLEEARAAGRGEIREGLCSCPIRHSLLQ